MGRHRNKRYQKAKTRIITKWAPLQQNWWSKNGWNFIGFLLTILTGLALPFYFQYESDRSQQATTDILSTVQALQSTTVADLTSSNLTIPSIIHVPTISIPAIGVKAPIELVSLTTNGTLREPAQSPWTDVGLYAKGTSFGQHGSEVISGHLDRPGGIPAVFWRLRELQVGNEIEVFNSDGKTFRFQVTSIEYYQTQKLPIQYIFGDNTGIYLNLMTNAGDWIPSLHQTTLRLVIHTTFVEI